VTKRVPILAHSWEQTSSKADDAAPLPLKEARGATQFLKKGWKELAGLYYVSNPAKLKIGFRGSSGLA
jgi:hypothetical protein